MKELIILYAKRKDIAVRTSAVFNENRLEKRNVE